MAREKSPAAKAAEILGVTGSKFHRVFALAGIAEEEIAAAVERRPDRAPALQAAFLLLSPGEFASYGERLYRSHARELLERVIEGKGVALGTDAECLIALSLGSLRAPLERGHLAAMESVFASVYPERVPEKGSSVFLQGEEWPGQKDEILAALRKRIASRGRT
jgi:hypothetical protein